MKNPDLSKYSETVILRCNLGTASLVLEALQFGLHLYETVVDDVFDKDPLLDEYKEIVDDLQYTIENRYEESGGLSTSTPPLIMVTIGSSKKQEYISSQSAAPKSKLKSTALSKRAALSTTKAIISKSWTSEGNSAIRKDVKMDQFLRHPQITAIQSVNIDYLRKPQQLAAIGLLLPKLPVPVATLLPFTSYPTPGYTPFRNVPTRIRLHASVGTQ